MSRQLINEYRSDLERIKSASGSLNESTLRDAFQGLLKSWGKSNDLIYLSEYEKRGPNGNLIKIDGALVYSIRVPLGYWEAKDSKDDLDEEIRKKEAKGYPRSNIIYEDTERAILIQNKKRVMEAQMDDTEALYQLLNAFFSYEREAISDFRKAIAQFSEDLPTVLNELRRLITEKRRDSEKYKKAEQKFLDHAKDAINPAVTVEDVQEMLIQHILTEQIFAQVFDTPGFHQQNNVAKELYALESELFGYAGKRTLLQALKPYYTGINSAATLIESHSEKQGFLKSLYENFYKVYNPKAADRLGVVYTPGEIVRFMIRSTDYLCEKHFGKNLIDKGVDILDPATGTGTYIVELLEHFRGDRKKLAEKYDGELHANEVAILPYYVANLNIEATYQSIMNSFVEFQNLCLVDTLDNVASVEGIKEGTHVADLFGGISDENIDRIKRQNAKDISVVIGNPPYNANQKSENENNKNRTYPAVDAMIKKTYVASSNARKTKRYDMYSRFLRWSTGRLGDNGIIAFICNRNFIDSKEADGFRKTAQSEFSKVVILDLGGDWKDQGRGGGSNVFDISTGVAIGFFIKTEEDENFTVDYFRVPESNLAEDKLSWLSEKRIEQTKFTTIKPDDRGSWVDQLGEDGEILLPLGNDETKSSKIETQENAIFKVFTPGISTNRDAWVIDKDRKTLAAKSKLLVQRYDGQSPKSEFRDDMKWSRTLKKRFEAKASEKYDQSLIREIQYRPFSARWIYFSNLYVDETGLHSRLLPPGVKNKLIGVSIGKRSSFAALATKQSHGLDFFLPNGAQVFAQYRYSEDGKSKLHNITDWAVKQFVAYYEAEASITKDAIFAYCYAVLHDPIYREKYALNLKREFPRIPFYPDFAQWVEWGEALMKMHIDYEEVKPWKVKRVDTPSKRAAKTPPKPKLKSTPEKGRVVVNEDTQITGIPAEAWEYRLGNRSAIDWVLDQHKEKKPRDPTIREKFNTYKFADYKESMIKLLAKVVRVSVDTVEITEAMKALDRTNWE